MAYILPVNSGMLSLVIPDKREQLVCATAIAAFCGCWRPGVNEAYIRIYMSKSESKGLPFGKEGDDCKR